MRKAQREALDRILDYLYEDEVANPDHPDVQQLRRYVEIVERMLDEDPTY